MPSSTFRVTSVPVCSGPAPALMPRYLYEPTISMVGTGSPSSERYGCGVQNHFFAFPDTAIRNEADLAAYGRCLALQSSMSDRKIQTFSARPSPSLLPCNQHFLLVTLATLVSSSMSNGQPSVIVSGVSPALVHPQPRKELKVLQHELQACTPA